MNVCKFLYDAPCCFALSVVPVRTQTTRYSGLSNSSRWGVDIGTELALQSKKSKFSPTLKMRSCRVFCSVTNVNTAHVSVSHPGRSTPVTIGGSRNYQLQLSLLCKQFMPTHTQLTEPGWQLQAEVDEVQERSLLGLMREFTLTFMQWWVMLVLNPNPSCLQPSWADFAAAKHVCSHLAIFGFICYTSRINFVVDVALLLY